MRKNIAAVIESWKLGEMHREDTCRTDGMTVWSYELPIARQEPDGRVLVLDVDKAPSRTTKMQIRAVTSAVKEFHGVATLEES